MKGVILPNTDHPLLAPIVLRDGRQCSHHRYFSLSAVGLYVFFCQCAADKMRFLLIVVKEGLLKIFSLGSQKSVSYNKDVVR
jgi:hypothetical protein